MTAEAGSAGIRRVSQMHLVKLENAKTVSDCAVGTNQLLSLNQLPYGVIQKNRERNTKANIEKQPGPTHLHRVVL